MIVGMCCFIDPEPFGPLHLSPHVIHTILRFFRQILSTARFLEKLVRKKLNQTGPRFSQWINLLYKNIFCKTLLLCGYCFV
jgi:hypothetical protein